MTNEARELLAKAEGGDAESTNKVAMGYTFGKDGFEQDPEKAVKWLKIAVRVANDSDNKPVALHALKLLTAIYLGDLGANFANASGVIECFEERSEKHQDIVAMINLGVIYCGDPDNNYIRTLPELAEHYNPKRGFSLIEKGVKFGESEAGNPIGYNQYSAIYCAYHANTTQSGRRPKLAESSYFTFAGVDYHVALASKAVYGIKTNEAIKTGKGVSSNLPPENVKVLTAISGQQARSAAEELYRACKVGYLNREQVEEIKQQRIPEMRKEGYVQHEVADLLIKHLFYMDGQTEETEKQDRSRELQGYIAWIKEDIERICDIPAASDIVENLRKETEEFIAELEKLSR